MKRTALFGLLITIMFLFSAFPLVGAGINGNDLLEEIEYSTPDEPVQTPGEDIGMVTMDELVNSGLAEMTTIPYDDFMEKSSPMGQQRSEHRILSELPFATKDENDGVDNATELKDGDEVTNNVTTWLDSQKDEHFSDVDVYFFNLTTSAATSSADNLNLTIFSQDAVNKTAYIQAQCFALLAPTWWQTYTTIDTALVGGSAGNTSYIDATPDVGITTQTIWLYYYVIISCYNDTMVNYTLEVDITPVTQTEWDGNIFTGMQVNATNRPSTMQSVQQAHDSFDWYDFTPKIVEQPNFNSDRGDVTELSFRFEVATEQRATQLGYDDPGAYEQYWPSSSMGFLFFAFHNYTDNLVYLYNIISVSVLWGSLGAGNNKRVTLGIQDQQIDAAWLGVNVAQFWAYFSGPSGTLYPGATTDGQMQYNVTNIATVLIPPNGPPSHNLGIQDYIFNEDEGPWVNLTDLDDHFSDPQTEHNERLRFEVVRVDTDEEIEIEIDEETHMLSIRVTEENWHSNGIMSDFRIRCYDWGPNWVYNDPDDLSVVSNEFTVLIASVNDDAYIEKVDLPAGDTENTHEPIHITIPQGASVRSKKIWGRDNDTEDQGGLEYSHNASTPAFSISVNGQYNFIPTNDDVGTTWIRVNIDDGHAPSIDDYCILVFHVTNRNDAPTLVSIEWRDRGVEYDNLDTEDEPTFRNVDEDMEINFTVEAYDPDIAIGQPDKLAWNVGALGWEAHPHPTNPMKAYLTYLPTNDDAILGVAETTLSVSDTQGKFSQEITVVLYVDNVNDKPVILTVNGEQPIDGKVTLDTNNGLNAFEDQPYVITIEAEDIDPRDDITFITNDPSWQQSPVLGNDFGRNFTIIPNQDMVGIHSVRITVKDEDGSAETVLVTYEVVNTNDPPEEPRIRYDESVVRYPGNEIRFWTDDVDDPDGDELTYIWNFGDGTVVEGQEVYHNWSSDNEYYVTLVVKDPNGGESSEEITIIIVERPPEEVDPNLDTDGDGIPDVWEEENGLNKFDANDAIQDPDGDTFNNLKEYEYGSNPLDRNSHPPKETTDDGGISLLLILVIAIAAILLIGAVVFFLFVVMSKPKPVVQQQMYGQELPGQAPPGQLPPQQQVAPQELVAPTQEQLPPAPTEEKPPEDDYLDSFMEEAHKQIEESSAKGSDEENVWKPPTEEPEPEVHSQVDDLFDDSPSPEVTEAPAGEQPPSPPGIPKLPDLPPLPEL